MQEATRLITPHDFADATTADGVRLRVHENRFGSQEAQLVGVRVRDGNGEPTDRVAPGAAVSVDLEARVPAELGPVNCGLRLVRDDGAIALDAGQMLDGSLTQTIRLQIERLDIAAGHYAFDVGLYSADWERTYDFHWRAYPLTVFGTEPSRGVLAPPMRWIRD
jgi:hypothetical protein